jgi:Sap, sulfolipid-1-addressing protein
MQYILGLALLAAVSLAAPLLAILVVILTRPRPRPLLWAFWLSALALNIVAGLLFLVAFRAKGTFLGEAASGVHPGVFIVIGCIAIAAAAFALTGRGRELIGREMEKKRTASATTDDTAAGRLQAKAAGAKAKAEAQLEGGSLLFVVVLGLVMGATTPYQIAGVGAMVRDDYGLVAQVALVVAFSLITYILVEIPVVLYTVRPEATAARVAALAAWLEANKIQAAAVVAAGVGLVLIGKGVTSL